MARHKIEFEGPILAGRVSTVSLTCSNQNCACRRRVRPVLHGPYYRWSGIMDGKHTTRTLTKEQARECERRIKRLRQLEAKIDRLLHQALKEAPWNE